MNTPKDESTVEKTDAQEIFGGRKLINERPEGMSFESYKLVRYLQSKILKKLFTHKPSRRIAQLMPVRPGYNLHFNYLQ